jgi:hypothetical protein
MDEHAMGGKQIHDANIVASMLVHNIPTLMTLNTVDFTRFSDKIALLTPEALLQRSDAGGDTTPPAS